MHTYHVAADYKGRRGVCQTPQAWTAYVYADDGRLVRRVPGAATKRMARAIALDIIRRLEKSA